MTIRFEGERPQFSQIIENGSQLPDVIAFTGDFPVMRDEQKRLLDSPLQAFEIREYRESGVRGAINVDEFGVTIKEEGSPRTLRLFNSHFRRGMRIIRVTDPDNPVKGHFGRIYPVEKNGNNKQS